MAEIRGYQCCFCDEDLDETFLDPCALAVTNKWLKPDEENFTQQFFCHAECLRKRMSVSVTPYAYFADPEWQDDSFSPKA